MKQLELNKKVPTFNDLANFYLASVPGKDRYFWQSVSPKRMLEISFLLKKEDIMDRLVDALDEVDDELRRIIGEK